MQRLVGLMTTCADEKLRESDMQSFLHRTVFSILLAAPVLIPAFAAAQNYPTAPAGAAETTAATNGTETKFPRLWDVTLGGGVAVRPTYEGSDRYRVAPVPFVNITYDDMISLGVNGLSAYWHRHNFRVGGGLTYSGGRKDSESNGIFDQGDNRLKGLGDINAALGLKAFAAYNLGLLEFNGSVTKFVSGNNGAGANNGTLVNLGIARLIKLTSQFTVTPHIGTAWANHNYMQTFFGITPVQATNSSFSRFAAHSGFKDVEAGINANYRFDQHWFVGANADVKELTGDAAKSPISFSDTQVIFMTMAGYHF
jgi:outer membrane scaffolding protein for murein synthesis (MipA/OmpV family)